MPGSISLQIPQSGQPNSTEDVKIASDLATIQTAINGNLDDTNLYSPNNAVRRLLLSITGLASGNTAASYLITQAGALVGSGGSTPVGVPLWAGDAGLSGQPADFQVANKTAYGRIRGTAAANGVSSGVSFTLGLYQISAVGGTGNAIQYTFGSAIAGTTVTLGPTASQAINGESAQFALPTANSYYALGVSLNGTMAVNSSVALTVQLYAYNA